PHAQVRTVQQRVPPGRRVRREGRQGQERGRRRPGLRRADPDLRALPPVHARGPRRAPAQPPPGPDRRPEPQTAEVSAMTTVSTPGHGDHRPAERQRATSSGEHPPLFPPGELEKLHTQDRQAASFIIGIILGIVILALLLYTGICFWVAAG